MINQTLSHYRILAKLGQGGMGVVYRAEDTTLGRQVAVKVLPDIFSGDPERMARFEREARLLASLNHPNIAAIHGLEEAGGERFIVMELAEGETLAKRITRGPLALGEALEVCRQVAAGLEAAHEKGVIHRDLKPSNVMISPEGKIKILDFGLARALVGEASISDPAQSPTITDTLTRPGVMLGTAAYMSPEQARGKPVDKRADIWAFGCLLYECLTGNRAFHGATVTDAIAKILEAEPDWDALPGATPGTVRSLVRRCLQKDRSRRHNDITDARIEIEEALGAPSSTDQTTARVLGRHAAITLLSTAILVGLVGVALGWLLKRLPEASPKPTARFAFSLPERYQPPRTSSLDLSISPDGSKIAYIANEQLYLRKLDAIEARPIQGIQEEIQSPFFSPDGEWIGFWSWTEGGILKKIAVGGGSAITLCRTTSPFGVCWWEDNTILFGQGQSVMRVSANGGTPEVLIRSNPDELVYLSQVLPGGKEALLSVTSGSGTWDKASIVAASLESGERRVIIQQGGGIAHYVSTGHLVYVSGTTLFAAPLNLDRLEVGASSVPILSGLMPSRGLDSVTQYCFSDLGSLVYAPAFVTTRRLAWVDSRGIATPLAVEERNYGQVRFSPDCTKAAAAIQNDQGVWEIWVLDLGEKPSFKLAAGSHPVWTPDGRRIIFHSTSTGDICWIPADGSALEPEVLLKRSSPQFPFPWSCSPDGKVLFFYENPNFDIGRLQLDGERRAEYAIKTNFYEGQPSVSPDGRRLAYVSNRSGSRGIWIQSYPDAGAPILISPSGEDPVWSRDGRRLFFRTSDRMMSVAIEAGEELKFRPAETLFAGRYHFGWFPNYDYSRDGRFMMIQQVSTSAEIIVVLNWFEELKRLVPTGK